MMNKHWKSRTTSILLLTLLPWANAEAAPPQPPQPEPASIPDWIHDALVVTNPAAAVGGAQAGIYTPAENGVRPWRQAIIRWLTSRSVRGNGGVLVRQEGPKGGAGLSAVVDPQADYAFEVMVHLPGKKGSFGTPQDASLRIIATVLDANDQVLALHLVNGKIDVEADQFRPTAGSQWRVRLPDGLSVDRTLAITPDNESREGKPLPVEVTDGWATVVVPRIESYTIVAFYHGEALTASANLANARRVHWRARLAGCEDDKGFDTRLQKTLTLLRAGELKKGAPAAAELLRKAQSEFESKRLSIVN